MEKLIEEFDVKPTAKFEKDVVFYMKKKKYIRANVEFYIFRVNFEFYLIKTVVSTGSTTSRKVIEPVEMTLKLRNKQFF